jgi:aminoglycoside phosphotransferase
MKASRSGSRGLRQIFAVGRIDPREFHERNLGLSPKQLFDRLLATAPSSEDIVVVHGDATFTNLLIDSTGTLGFIDCGSRRQS